MPSACALRLLAGSIRVRPQHPLARTPSDTGFHSLSSRSAESEVGVNFPWRPCGMRPRASPCRLPRVNFRPIRLVVWVLAIAAYAESSAIAPSAAELVARWKKAAGAGSHRADAVVHLVSRSTEDGIDGNVEEWISREN